MLQTRIKNTILAGWCADAVGAQLEFQCRRFSEQEVDDAMRFLTTNSKNGINKGQFTDDSEMEICLLRGLLNGKDEGYFPIEHVAKEYTNGITQNLLTLDKRQHFP
jgi:ADP-ribosylglycohydrolase